MPCAVCVWWVGDDCTCIIGLYTKWLQQYHNKAFTTTTTQDYNHSPAPQTILIRWASTSIRNALLLSLMILTTSYYWLLSLQTLQYPLRLSTGIQNTLGIFTSRHAPTPRSMWPELCTHSHRGNPCNYERRAWPVGVRTFCTNN